jgi:beta-D-xylosidase 4
MVTGFQEEDSAGHPKVLAYLKHFTMYNGPQATDTPKEVVSLHDLHETFLEQYRIAFVEGNATGAMCSYNVSHSAPCPLCNLRSQQWQGYAQKVPPAASLSPRRRPS